MLVLDASVAVEVCFAQMTLDELGDPHVCAPALLWSETRSALHELAWRGSVTVADAHRGHEALSQLPVERRDHPQLGGEAWRIADELGWAKTYDAEYVALARLLGCRLVTLDGRLRRGADRLGFVVGPLEL